MSFLGASKLNVSCAFSPNANTDGNFQTALWVLFFYSIFIYGFLGGKEQALFPQVLGMFLLKYPHEMVSEAVLQFTSVFCSV